MSIPSYEELFGTGDYKSSDEYRTVLSPAAYLVDLLLLKDVMSTFYDLENFYTDEQLSLPDFKPGVTPSSFRNKNPIEPIQDKIYNTRQWKVLL
jgi:hypothetical protein